MKNKELDAMKAVYCYHFPEVRSILHEVERVLPDEMYFVTSPAGLVQERISQLFREPIEIPATPNGNVDLDMVHVPIIDRVVRVYSGVVSGLDSFPYIYPTNGSSEGLFHILTRMKVNDEDKIYTLDGEYEGYGEQAKNLKMCVETVDPEDIDPRHLPRGTWFISNPSARDGNALPDDLIYEICDAGHKVYIDLAYAGMTGHTFDVNPHENVEGVVLSFSKPYGVFRHRLGGFAFTRREVPTLYGNKWFKDVPGLFQALKLVEDIGPEGLYPKYKGIQKSIVGEINDDLDLGMRPSDVFLLGNINGKDADALDMYRREIIMNFRRGHNYRFCLTPYFEMREKSDSVQ